MTHLPKKNLLIALFLAVSSAGFAAPTAVEIHGRLRVDGNRVVDQHGDPVTLRGMSFYWSSMGGQSKYYNTNVVRWLRDDWHCNLIRVAMGVEGDGYLAHPDREKAKMIAMVDAAIADGIYVLIDWHDHHADQHRAQAEAFFEEMAARYASVPNVIYETWNEPVQQDWAKVIKPYHEAVVARIRARDPLNLIACGTQTYAQEVNRAAMNPVPGSNIVYTLHFYASTHQQGYRNKAAAALKNGAALMVTEYGTCEANGSGRIDEADFARWVEFMNQNGLSSCNWSVADLTETSAALRPGASPDGGWSTNQVSASGNLVRNMIRTFNPAP
ncbi:MAG: glycoside hydrolase family 5 protein [Verrucomicrobiota bacterium]